MGEPVSGSSRPEEIREAGRELDLAIHACVFGHEIFTQDAMRIVAETAWRSQPTCREFFYPIGFRAIEHSVIGGDWRFEQRCPHYSTDIAAAWLVVEKMRELGFCATIESDGRHQMGPWRATFDRGYKSPRFEVLAHADESTAPLAICVAALRALQNAHDTATPR